MKKKQIIGVGLLFLILLAAFGVFWLMRKDTIQENKLMQTLTVKILKVGRADAIIIQLGEEVIVIDAGEEEDGQEVVDYLTKRHISQVKALIITHFDKDHVGGADTLLEKLDIEEVIMPDYPGNSTDYSEMLAALDKSKKEKDTREVRLTGTYELELGKAHFFLEAPNDYTIPEGSAEYDNDFSIITTVRYGETTLLFMGDAEKTLTRAWLGKGLDRNCDFVKMPHHGVYNASMIELLDALSPQCAAICSSGKNPADQKTLELMKVYGVNVMETRNGDITLTSDGISLRIKQ